MKRLRIPENLTTLAHRHIRDYILEGNLQEEGRLTEEYLSQQLGISKSPIREALNRLEAEGLIRIEPRRGAYLRTFSLAEVADLYDFREALEAHAVLTARLTPQVLDQLHTSVASLRQYLENEQKDRYIEEDIRFHSTIAQASGNQRLVQAIDNLQDQLRILRRKTYSITSSRAVPMHASVVDRLASGDRSAAVETMREHIRFTKEQLLAHMAGQDNAPVARVR